MTDDMNGEDSYTTEELAAKFKVNTRTVYSYLKKGKIKKAEDPALSKYQVVDPTLKQKLK